MELSAYDVRMLRTLIENALAEVDTAAEPDAMILPAGILEAMTLMEHYDWGKAFLDRLTSEPMGVL